MLSLYLSLIAVLGASARNINLVNSCPGITIYPYSSQSAAEGSGTCQGGKGGVAPGKSVMMAVPDAWASGRISAATGSCGNSNGQAQTLAEITLDSKGAWLDISIIGGFNLPMKISAQGCAPPRPTEITTDLNLYWPANLRDSSGSCWGTDNLPHPLGPYLRVNGTGTGTGGGCTVDRSAMNCQGAWSIVPNNPWRCSPQNFPYYDAIKSLAPYSYVYPADDQWPNGGTALPITNCPSTTADLTVEWCPGGVGSVGHQDTSKYITDSTATGAFKVGNTMVYPDYSLGSLDTSAHSATCPATGSGSVASGAGAKAPGAGSVVSGSDNVGSESRKAVTGSSSLASSSINGPDISAAAGTVSGITIHKAGQNKNIAASTPKIVQAAAASSSSVRNAALPTNAAGTAPAGEKWVYAMWDENVPMSWLVPAKRTVASESTATSVSRSGRELPKRMR